MGKMSQLDAYGLDRYTHDIGDHIFTLTITALSPKSYNQDLTLIKRVHKRFGESFSHLDLDCSTVRGYEVQTKRKAHSLHMHTYFTSMALPVFNPELLVYLKKVKCKIQIDPVVDFQGWFNYCIKDQAVDHRWAYEQYHSDMFQEG